jgi:hypothetical protein
MADVTSPFGFPYPEDTDLVRDGASDIENLAEGVNDYLTGGYLYAGTRYYTSSGTFAKADPLGTGDIGLRAVRLRVVGGGGGGGGAATTSAGEAAAGGGGGGAAYAESFILASALTSSVTVTLGAGGSGGAEGANIGSNGGASSFGSGETFEVSAEGGFGGTGSVARSFPDVSGGGAGGAVAVGDLTVEGSPGFPSSVNPTATGTARALGGGSFLSGYGPVNAAGRLAAGGGGITGTGRFGGGGSSGANIENQATARAGGAGRVGVCIVDCFV